MAVTQKKPSASWAISAGVSLGGGKKAVGASALFLTLLDVESQIFFSAKVVSAGLGAGFSVIGTLSTFSPSFFRTSKPLWAKDMWTTSMLAGAGLTVGVGASLCYLHLIALGTDPYWLDIGGVDVGLSAGAGGSLGWFWVDHEHGWDNNGCIIAPGGDPLCGGASKAQGQSSSSTPGMSR